MIETNQQIREKLKSLCSNETEQEILEKIKSWNNKEKINSVLISAYQQGVICGLIMELLLENRKNSLKLLGR